MGWCLFLSIALCYRNQPLPTGYIQFYTKINRSLRSLFRVMLSFYRRPGSEKVCNWKRISVIKLIQRRTFRPRWCLEGDWHFCICETYRTERCQKVCGEVQNNDYHKEVNESKFIEKKSDKCGNRECAENLEPHIQHFLDN